MAELILGPLLRHVGPQDATVWIEADAACGVEVLGQRARTFHVEGHHYAIVYITGLKPGSIYEYSVALDGRRVWPQPGSPYPPSVIRTPGPDRLLTIVFGSCRTCLPHSPPYTLLKAQDPRGRGIDVLRALALRLVRQPPERWPQALLFLGDQVYADEVSPGARAFIRARRDPDEPPGDEVADFEEYTRLYWDSWGEPSVRWLLSTLPTAMIFDDHDVNDDWNISAAWVADQRTKPWWEQRIIGGFMSYWIYQHLGNLSPRELEQDEVLRQVREVDDAGPFLREFARRVDRDPQTYRWSFYRDFSRVRLVMIDTRAARALDPAARTMIHAKEWAWIERHVRGDFEHLLLGASLPVLLAPGIHYLEAWSEAVCGGAWGKWPIRPAERLRRALDLEHWAAFQCSFEQLAQLLRKIGRGAYGRAPATIVLLSGDVHHAYLAEASYPQDAGMQSAVYQAVCSPFRNALGKKEQLAIKAGWGKAGTRFWQALARAAGVREPEFDWELTHDAPWFGNQIATLEMDGRGATLRIERPASGGAGEPRLEEAFSYRLDP